MPNPDEMSYSDFVASLASKHLHPNLVPRELAASLIDAALLEMTDLDGLKKALFGGRDNEHLQVQRKYRDPAGADEYAGINTDSLHGVIGLRTEIDELLDMMSAQLRGGPEPTRDKAIDECGDILFYLVLYLLSRGATLRDALLGNMAKLKVRFPDGAFDPNRVGRENRDTAAETRAQEEAACQ